MADEDADGNMPLNFTVRLGVAGPLETLAGWPIRPALDDVLPKRIFSLGGSPLVVAIDDDVAAAAMPGLWLALSRSPGMAAYTTARTSAVRECISAFGRGL